MTNIRIATHNDFSRLSIRDMIEARNDVLVVGCTFVGEDINGSTIRINPLRVRIKQSNPNEYILL